MGVLAAAAVFLLTLVAWEGMLPPLDSAEPRAIMAPAPSRRAASPAPAASPSPVAAWVATILARPLFAPDRRPPSLTGMAANRVALPRLAGTIRTKSGLRAIFAPSGAPKQVAVGLDGWIAGWKLADIGDGEVILEQNGRTATLRLSYDKAPTVEQVERPQAYVLLHSKRTSAFLQP